MSKKLKLTNKIAPKAASKTVKAEPKAAPKAAPKADAKAAPKAVKAEPKAEPKAAPKKPETFAIHINKTGRLCFGKDAAVRLGDTPFCEIEVDEKARIIRLEASKKSEGNLPVRDAAGRPYVSATKQFKPLGFDGSRSYDCEAKPYGIGGFEFKMA